MSEVKSNGAIFLSFLMVQCTSYKSIASGLKKSKICTNPNLMSTALIKYMVLPLLWC